MPKVSVYLPDELYRRAKELELPLSTLIQAAIVERLEQDPNAAWIRDVRSRPARYSRVVDTADLLNDVRDGFDQ